MKPKILFVSALALPLVAGAQNGSRFQLTIPNIMRGPELYGREPQNPPDLGEVASIMLEHARLLVEWVGETAAMRMFRKHSTWYTKGFRGSAELRQRLVHVSSLAELADTLAQTDPSTPFPPDAMRVPRGKASGRQRVQLPEGYLDQLDDDAPPLEEVCEDDSVEGG